MGHVSSFYLCRNSVGTYCFQRRVPQSYRLNARGLPELVRLSLRTQNRQEAKRLARMLAVMLDLNAHKYFANYESYRNAVETLGDFLDAHQRSRRSALEFFDAQCTSRYQRLESERCVSSVNKRSLEDAFEEFITQKRPDWKKVGGMEEGYRVYFSILKELVGDIDTSELTKAHVIEFVTAVQSIPANRNKHSKYRKKKVRDLIRMNVPVSERLSPITRKRYLGQMSSFFQWLHNNDYNPTELHLPIKNVRIKTVRSVDQKPIYTPDDLEKLFNSEQYVFGTHRKPSHFWVPLIGLYTGARLNEICQLSVADILVDKITGRWVIDINENLKDDPRKSLKRSFHARLVPVHQKLIDLGFLEYCKSRVNRSHKKLFPELEYVSGVNKYGDRFQRWFNRTYAGQCRTSQGTSFHSFRHTVITHLVNDRKVDANRIAVGFGQTPVGGITQSTYTKRMAFRDYAQYFDLIDFDDCFDSSKIIHWCM